MEKYSCKIWKFYQDINQLVPIALFKPKKAFKQMFTSKKYNIVIK